ncbi:MAG: hypothetical protein PUF99_00680 [Bacilli bacterium]|nr:hypothetical protein [Bacilli bacterium]
MDILKNKAHFNIDSNATFLKQHLSLSKYAYSIIDNDIDSFTYFNKDKSFSGFLNTIFFNFYKDSKASIEYLKDLKIKELDEIYTKLSKENIFINNKKDIIEKEINSYINKCKDEVNKITTSSTILEGRKFRINKENINILKSSLEDKYYSKLGDYLKAIFEEYTSLPYFKRERIYFKDEVNKINEAIKNNKRLKIKFNDEDNKTFYIIPYKLIEDNFKIYNYLIGYFIESSDVSSIYNTTSDDSFVTKLKLCNKRLSTISYIAILSSSSFHINKKTREDIEYKLSTKNIKYLNEKEVTFSIKFSKLGLIKFKKEIINRPNKFLVDSKDLSIYHINCSLLQAKDYFINFISLITVLSSNDESIKLKNFLNNYVIK